MAVLGKVTAKFCSLAGVDGLDDRLCFVFFFTTGGLKLPWRDRNCGNEGAEAPEMMRTPCQSVGGEFPSKTPGIFFPSSTSLHIVYCNSHFRIWVPHRGQSRLMAAVIAPLEYFNDRWPIVDNSVSAVSVTLSSSHLFPLKSTTRLWLLQRLVQCAVSPFAA